MNSVLYMWLVLNINETCSSWMNVIWEFSKVNSWMFLVQSSVLTSILPLDLHPPTSQGTLYPGSVTSQLVLLTDATVFSSEWVCHARCWFGCLSRIGPSSGVRVALKTGYLFFHLFANYIYMCGIYVLILYYNN